MHNLIGTMKGKIYLSLMILMGLICLAVYKLFDTEQGYNWIYPIIPGILGLVFMFLSMSSDRNEQ